MRHVVFGIGDDMALAALGLLVGIVATDLFFTGWLSIPRCRAGDGNSAVPS